MAVRGRSWWHRQDRTGMSPSDWACVAFIVALIVVFCFFLGWVTQ